MKRHISLVTLVALLLGLSAVQLWAQATGSVKGVVKDQNGKPVEGVTVELTSSDTGKKYDLKTNSKGEYSSIGVVIGTYDFTLMKDGKTVDQITKVPVVAGGEPRVVDFDFTKRQVGPTEEQKKQVEEVQKHNEKVKTLNASLTQARQLEASATDDISQAKQLQANGKADQAQAKQADASAKYEQAITVLQQATQVDPTQDLLWYRLGDMQKGAKKYPEAIESYQKAIAIKGTVGGYHNNLADAYAKSGQSAKAVQEFAAAAEVDPANGGMYYFNEGVVFVNANKMDEALVAFDKVIQIDPNKAAAYYFKGNALLGKAVTKGDKMVAPEGTAEAYNKYLQLDPNGPYADAAKGALAAIGAPVQTSYGTAKAPKKKPQQ
jgi:tetratricopeptide (TPR) repeat protein